MSIKLPYVKLGTVPFGAALVKNKRLMPKVGDTIFIKEDNPKKSAYNNPWKRVCVDKVKDDYCWFVHGV
jgi:hypothetical protein